MERSEEVLAEFAATDGVDPVGQKIGELRERIQGVRIHIDGFRAQLDETEREVQAVAMSLGWVPAERG